MELWIFHVLLAVHVFDTDARQLDSWKLVSHPSVYLEPPPIARSYQISQPSKNRHSTRSAHWLQQQANVAPVAKLWPSLGDSMGHRSAYAYHELRCNPCNSIPWIPIISFARAKAIPQPQQASYYHTFNEMSANLIKPVNLIAPTLPAIYIGPPVYQQHFTDDAAAAAAAALWQTGTQAVAKPLPPVVDKPTPDADGLSNWINDLKPIPLHQYSHSVDYAPVVGQSSFVDSQNGIASGAVPPPYEYNVNNVDDHVRDVSISNHLIDDTKYSSSENKISVATNATSVDDIFVRLRKLPQNSNASSSVELSLIDYLTPPSIASSDDWTKSNDDQVPSSQIKPFDDLADLAFANKIETRPDKRKKQIQIIIPYTVKGKHTGNVKVSRKEPDETEITSIRSSSASTTVSPIVRYLRENATAKKQLPNEITDWHKLRNAIDTWTVERFSNHKYEQSNSSRRFDFTSSTSTPATPATPASATHLVSSSSPSSSPSIEQVARQFVKVENARKPDEMVNRAGINRKWHSSRKLSMSLATSLSSTTIATVSAKERVYIVTPIPLSNYFNFTSNDIDAYSSWLG